MMILLVIRHRVTTVLLAAALLAAGPCAFAQSDDSEGAAAEENNVTDDIEELFSQPEQEAAPATRDAGEKAPVLPEMKELSDLKNLAPFSDVAVIQKRYLPKTGRFELFGGGTTILNDAFFLGFGLNARLGYYFRERYGVEFVSMVMQSSKKTITKDLDEKRGITTTSLVSPKNYFGLDFKWTPIYGKMSLNSKTITPFDLYFSLGGGTTSTTQGSSPTVHLGAGQIFALSKSSAFRWDFSWNFFQSKSSVSGSTSESNYNNLFLTFGFSFFFPEATYR